MMIGGVLMALYAVAGLFFFKFWKKTHDRLLGMFAVALWALGLERILLVIIPTANEFRPYVYMARLFAFIIIILAIVDKNKNS